MTTDDKTTERGLWQEQHERRRESLKRIIEPVQQEVAAIDARLAELDDERQALLSDRRELFAVVRAADPEAHKQVKAAKAKAHANGEYQPAEGTKTRLLDFLREHGGDFAEGFNTRALTDDERLAMDKTTIGRVLPALADDGLLRLDRIGYLGEHRTGRESRIYKLIESGGE